MSHLKALGVVREEFVVNGSWYFDSCKAGLEDARLNGSPEVRVLTGFSILAVPIFILIMFLRWSLVGRRMGAGIRRENPFEDILLIPLFFIGLVMVLISRAVDCKLACGSWAAPASSISYIAANVSPHGYAYLLVMLIFTSNILYQRIEKIASERRKQTAHFFALTKRKEAPIQKTPSSSALSVDLDIARDSLRERFSRKKTRNKVGMTRAAGFMQRRIAEWLMRIGITMMTLTGMIPSPAHNCDVLKTEEYCYQKTLSSLHGMIAPGIGISLVGAFLALFSKRPYGRSWPWRLDHFVPKVLHRP